VGVRDGGMTDKPHNDGQWTVARFNSFIKGGLRQISRRWPPKYKVKKDAWVERGVYQCAGYKKRKHRAPVSVINDKKKRVNNIFVDHIDPIVDPEVGFTNWDSIISRMFCEATGLQVLCSECHKRKTDDERSRRI
jgi:hypothetical protein